MNNNNTVMRRQELKQRKMRGKRMRSQEQKIRSGRMRGEDVVDLEQVKDSEGERKWGRRQKRKDEHVSQNRMLPQNTAALQIQIQGSITELSRALTSQGWMLQT